MEQEAQSMKGYHFYAMLSRMKYINRWGLMRNTREENICEHSLEVAMIAHSLAVLKNQRFGGRVNPERNVSRRCRDYYRRPSNAC